MTLCVVSVNLEETNLKYCEVKILSEKIGPCLRLKKSKFRMVSSHASAYFQTIFLVNSKKKEQEELIKIR
jgi:hypothetical protein